LVDVLGSRDIFQAPWNFDEFKWRDRPSPEKFGAIVNVIALEYPAVREGKKVLSVRDLFFQGSIIIEKIFKRNFGTSDYF
jgi:hypothetical protein